jgi:hypothetical protein
MVCLSRIGKTEDDPEPCPERPSKDLSFPQTLDSRSLVKKTEKVKTQATMMPTLTSAILAV